MRSITLCMKVLSLFMLAVAGFMMSAPVALAEPYFLIDSEAEWTANLGPQISAVDETGWNAYIAQWNQYLTEGDPYPPTEFLPATLYVYPGDPDIGDAGLVMAWEKEALRAAITPAPGNMITALIRISPTPPSKSRSRPPLPASLQRFLLPFRMSMALSFPGGGMCLLRRSHTMCRPLSRSIRR